MPREVPVAYLCDFDGTISPADVGAALVRRFAHDAEGALPALLERWSRDELGHRELTEAECARMRVEEWEARAFVSGFALDPAFGAFVAAVRARGDAVMVVSEGFEFYVRAALARAGLSDLPVAANRARFEGG